MHVGHVHCAHHRAPFYEDKELARRPSPYLPVNNMHRTELCRPDWQTSMVPAHGHTHILVLVAGFDSFF